MAHDTNEIDRLVREVISRMNVGAPAAQADPTPATGELVITARVVSVEEIGKRLTGIRRVVVSGKAIVTPAVIDLLRERRVELARQAATSPAKTSVVRLVVGVVETEYEPAALLRAIGQGGATVERLAKTGLKNVVNEMTDQVGRGGALGVLLTGRPAAALCLSNRARGVRAVSGNDAQGISKVVQDTAANVLVVDPAGLGPWAVQRTVMAFCNGGSRPCPAELA